MTTDERRADAADLLEQVHHLERKLETLPVIEQAKGMLMQDFGLDADSAYLYLRRISQDTNTKVRDVATRIVEELTGTSSTATSALTARTLNDLEQRLAEH
ncbi:MAG TPA: ANTAR domain-containing protein [Acidimicrobiales bacterium]|nr:ANTAR domain-containing protein [Acidimicrobiales bacterium]